MWLAVDMSLKTNNCLASLFALSTGCRWSNWFRSVVMRCAVLSPVSMDWPFRNCPGSRSVSPYTSSTVVASRSSCQAVRMPKRMVGNASVHRLLSWHLNAVFNWRWNLFTRPFACGWQAVVCKCLLPVSLFSCLNNWDSNWCQLISCDAKWDSKASNPSRVESFSNSLGFLIFQRDGFWPSHKAVDACEAIAKVLWYW